VTHKGALAAVYMSGGSLLAARKEHPSVAAAMELYGVGIAEIRAAIGAMKDVFVKQGTTPTENGWVFKHPTIREAMASIVKEDPDLVEIALRGNPLHGLLSETVCEGVEVRGAKLVIPESLYSLLIDRLTKQEPFTLWVADFLIDRATKKFRAMYFEAGADLSHPLIAENLKPTDRSCKLFSVLQVDGLLAAEALAAFQRTLVTRAKSLDCVEFPTNAKLILSPEQYEENIRLALHTLMDQIDDVVLRWVHTWDRDTRPESYFESLLELAADLSTEIGEELSDESREQIWDVVNNYILEMDNEYEANDEDHETVSDLVSPADAAVKLIKDAEIEAIFSDIAV
jgi:hypothetical protein